MNSKLGFEYQQNLNEVLLDEFAAIHFFWWIDAPATVSYQRAQKIVDFIYRCYKANLIMPSAYDDPWHQKTPKEVADIYASQPSSSMDWHWTQWCTTDDTAQVMNSFGIDDWHSPRNDEFIEWLIQRLANSGVPLNDSPLIPLQHEK